MKIPINPFSQEETKFDYRAIESFEDACERLSLDPTNLPNLSAIPKRFKKPLHALFKLMVIFEAVNNGWVPEFENLNDKFFPVFEIDTTGNDFSKCKYSSVANITKTSTFLCCRNFDEALYLSTQFADLYKDFCLINRSRINPLELKQVDPSKDIRVRSKHVNPKR